MLKISEDSNGFGDFWYVGHGIKLAGWEFLYVPS